ncbi:MAG: cytochrome c biogenesis protein CcsA, partial [Myxococcales bacterium]|nr:cytochrome c biogenesis protein CcsA [Myxococcales bacterium]
GLIFGVVVLVTGPLWAKAAWGVWWKWEPRLTTMAILFMIFSGYRLLRAFGGDGPGVRVFAAVLAVFGAPQIYFVHIAVSRWQGDHPNNVVMEPEMRVALYSNLGLMMIVFFLLLRLRYRVRRDALTVSALKRRLARMGAG